MRVFKSANVFEEALDRIRWLFDEFGPSTICCVSGGKDSTVVFNLMLMVAREKGMLPLKVMFIDQEAEWQATVEQIELIMHHPDVEPRWYQMPMRLFNATSSTEHWLHCWDPAVEHLWMHPKDPVSIKTNIYGTDRFIELFEAISRVEFGGGPAVHVAGVRTEESPNRRLGLTSSATYKWATWGSVKNKRLGHYTMYPIYDWSYLDVWKAIHDNGWHYNRIYDGMYNYGTPVRDMRVSNVHHETAVRSLFFMAELEPETWNRLSARLAGVDMAQKMGFADYMPKELPKMFESWKEYRDHLLKYLVTDPEWTRLFQSRFRSMAETFGEENAMIWKAQCRAILLNDWEGITLANFITNHRVRGGTGFFMASQAHR